jgi:hypothetical protein
VSACHFADELGDLSPEQLQAEMSK